MSNIVHRSKKGQSLVETALVVPLLLLLVVGVIDVGRAFNNYIIIANASREGARYGSRFPAHIDGIVQATVGEATDSGIVLTAADIEVFCPAGTGSGNVIQVTVSFTFTTIIGSLIGLDTLQLSTGTQMIIYGMDPAP
jgi:hypothetical protein